MSTSQTQNVQAQPSSTGGSSTGVPPHMRKEAALWAEFYERLDDPVFASVLVAKLKEDPVARRAHVALPMRAEETLRRHEIRTERFRSFGRFVGSTTRHATALISQAYRSVTDEMTASNRAMGAAVSQDKSPAVSVEAFCDLLVGDRQVAELLHRLFIQRPALAARHPALHARVVAAVNAEKSAKSSCTAA